MKKIVCAVLGVWFCFSGAVYAMTSTNYQIPFDSVNSGGTDWSTSTNYNLIDTVGEQATGFATSTNYILHAGYRQSNEFEYLSFSVGAAETSTKIAYTALSLSYPYSVTVNSTAGYSTGSHISVVENLGLTQKLAVGKIISILGNVLTVDKWDGDTGTMSPIPAGGNDFVYRSDGVHVQFGSLTPFVGSTANIYTEVSTNAINGYTVHVYSDGYLTNGTYNIHNVNDGSISGDVEEYGANVTGARSVGSGTDFAVTTTQTLIQSHTAHASDDRIGMNYKFFITYATQPGSYAQNVTYLLTANF